MGNAAYFVYIYDRTHEKLSPLARRSSSSLRSPRKDPRDQGDSRDKVSVSMSSQDKSPSLSESPPRARNRVPSEDRRYLSYLYLIYSFGYSV